MALKPGQLFTGLLVVLVAGSMLAIGAVHAKVLLAVAALAFAGALAVLLPGRADVPKVAWLVVGLAVYSALQALPLPVGLVQTVAPANADVWLRGLALIGETPGFVSISLDPGASLFEAVKWLTYAAVIVLAAHVASRRGPLVAITIVWASAVLASVVTLAHGLLEVTEVYGLYEPTFHASPWHIGPLLNPNNLAGYLNLGFLCGAGLIFSNHARVPGWLVGVGLALILGVDIISASRGGVLALPIGVAVLFVLVRKHVEGRVRTARGKLLIGGVLAAGTAFAVLGGTTSVWDELISANADKVDMLGWVAPLIEDHPVLGVGRGAFESAFPAYRLSAGNVIYTHVENFPLQWAAEWGVPVACVALVGFGWFLRPNALGVGHRGAITGAWIGIAVLLLQNLFDLALEVPGVTIAVAALVGSMAPRPPQDDEDEAPKSSRFARISLAVPLLGALSIGAVLLSGYRDIADQRKALHDAFENLAKETPEGVAALRARVVAACRARPAEPYFPLLGALLAQRSRSESPIPWIARALERAPQNGRAHLLLAEVLASKGATGQALFELRLAQEADVGLTDASAARALRITRNFDELAKAAPPGRSATVWYDALATRLRAPDELLLRQQCDRAALDADPARPAPHRRLANDLLRALENKHPEEMCPNQAACEAEVEAHARVLTQADAADSTASQLRARVLFAKGNAEAAEAVLSQGCAGARDRVDCLMLRLRVAATTNNEQRIATIEKELRTAACTEPVHCADMHTFMADVRRGRRDLRAALTHLERAAEADPSDARLTKLADAAAEVGEHVRAAAALERMRSKRTSADPALEQRIADERAKALRGLVTP